MAKEIAVLTDAEGKLAVWTEGGRLTVFRRENGGWREIASRQVSLDPGGGLGELRRQMMDMIAWLGECAVVLAAVVTGLPYFELEKAGVSIWELPGQFEKGMLETVLQEEALAERERRRALPVAVPVPEHLGNGRYRISIKEVQENGGGLTSKQVLQGFLQKGCFEEVEILCAHVPPWLESELVCGVLAGEREKLPGGMRVKVRRPAPEVVADK